MTKILLKHPGTNSPRKYQENMAKLIKVTIEVQSCESTNIEMVSAEELRLRKNNISSIYILDEKL